MHMKNCYPLPQCISKDQIHFSNLGRGSFKDHLALDASKPLGCANNKGADHLRLSHHRRLTSAFVIRFMESIIYKLAKSEISFFYQVSIAEETGLSLALSETT